MTYYLLKTSANNKTTPYYPKTEQTDYIASLGLIACKQIAVTIKDITPDVTIQPFQINIKSNYRLFSNSSVNVYNKG